MEYLHYHENHSHCIYWILGSIYVTLKSPSGLCCGVEHYWEFVII